MLTYTVTGEFKVVAPVSMYAVMVPLFVPAIVVKVNVKGDPVIPVPSGPDPVFTVTVAVCDPAVAKEVVNDSFSNQLPAVRAVLTCAGPGQLALVAGVALVFATTPSPLSVTVTAPLLVWKVPISPV